MTLARGSALLVLLAAVALGGAPARSPARRAKGGRADAGGAARPRRADGGTALRFGTVELRIRGEALVFVDGRELGKTPLRPLKLLEGPHQLRFVNQALGVDHTEPLEVRGGHRSVLELSFQQE